MIRQSALTKTSAGHSHKDEVWCSEREKNDVIGTCSNEFTGLHQLETPFTYPISKERVATRSILVIRV
jgi:hypothetical protein